MTLIEKLQHPLHCQDAVNAALVSQKLLEESSRHTLKKLENVEGLASQLDGLKTTMALLERTVLTIKDT